MPRRRFQFRLPDDPELAQLIDSVERLKIKASDLAARFSEIEQQFAATREKIRKVSNKFYTFL